MKQIIKNLIRNLVSIPLINKSADNPNLSNLEKMRKFTGIQLSVKQIDDITKEIVKRPNCRFLVFGLGYDSGYWSKINRGNETLFIEDSPEWIDIVKSKFDVEVDLVKYTTNIDDVDQDLENEHDQFILPIRKDLWDVILVDAPQGWRSGNVGRLQSIITGSKLLAESGILYVHDTNREGEAKICNHILKSWELITEIKDRPGYLRKYKKS